MSSIEPGLFHIEIFCILRYKNRIGSVVPAGVKFDYKMLRDVDWLRE